MLDELSMFEFGVVCEVFGIDRTDADRCGFATGALLRHHFRRALGVTPTDYRRSFKPPSVLR